MIDKDMLKGDQLDADDEDFDFMGEGEGMNTNQPDEGNDL